MPFIPPDVIAKAREMDLLTYLKPTSRRSLSILRVMCTAHAPIAA